MRVILLISLITLSSVTCLENCLLSSKNCNLSFIVTVRKRIAPNINKIICTGLIVDVDKVVIPIKCLTQMKSDNYYTGTELKAMTGTDEDSCVQVRDGLNYYSVNPNVKDANANALLRYVAVLETFPFHIHKGHEPYKALKRLLPDNEKNLKKYVDKITGKNITCSVVFFEQSDKNEVIRTTLLPIDKKECERRLCPEFKGIRGSEPSCPDMLWSPDTYSCLSMLDNEQECDEYDVGSPIICEDKVCGMLKRCDSFENIAIMQLLTVEHLDSLNALVLQNAILSLQAMHPMLLIMMTLLSRDVLLEHQPDRK